MATTTKAAGKKASKKAPAKRRVTLHVSFYRVDEIVLEVAAGVTNEELLEEIGYASTVYDKGDEFQVMTPRGYKTVATVVDIPQTIDEEVQDTEIVED